MIKIILWDVDGTLLDFKKAEYAAIKKCLQKSLIAYVNVYDIILTLK